MKSTGSLRVIIPLFAVLFAVSGGLLAASGSSYLVALPLALVLAGFLLALRASHTLALLALGVFVIAGTLKYFAGISQAMLATYLLALALTLKIVRIDSTGLKGWGGVEWVLLLIVATTGLSLIVNQPSALIALAGAKSLVGFIPVALLISRGHVEVNALARLWKLIALLPILQVPFVLYQYFVVAAGRSTAGGAYGVAWDAVVGSFGGNPESGGASGVLAVICISCSLLAVSLYRFGQMRGGLLALVLASATLCVMLAEVKVVVLLLPLGVIVYTLPQLSKRPFQSIAAIVACIVLAGGIVYSYSLVHYGSVSQMPDKEEFIDKTFGYSFDPDRINLITREMGRAAAFQLWAEDGFVENPGRGLIGYGPGASRGLSAFGIGEVARQYPYFIDRSAATQILWDIGLVGMLLFAILPVVAGVRAYQYRGAKQENEPAMDAVMCSAPAILAVCALMFPYGRDLLEVPALSFFFMALIGTVVLATRGQVAARRLGRRGSLSSVRVGSPAMRGQHSTRTGW